MDKIDLSTKIDDLVFPKGCQTIPSALKRTGFKTLEDVWKALNDHYNWPGVGPIRMRLIRKWFENCIDI